MEFAKALEALKSGYKVKLPTWAGYWVKEGDTVKMCCKNGDVLDIRETQDVFYTLSNIASNDWEVVGECTHNLVKTFRFGEALRNLKAGKRVARQGWNGKGQYLVYIDPYDNTQFRLWEEKPQGTFYPYVAIKTNYEAIVPWLASQTDMLAEDWVLVE